MFRQVLDSRVLVRVQWFCNIVLP